MRPTFSDAEVASVSIGDQFWCDIRNEWLTIDEVFPSFSAGGLRIANIHAVSDDGNYGRSTIITIHTFRGALRDALPRAFSHAA